MEISFKGGDSFPSEHSAAAWSIASVIAHEYPGPLTSVLAYGAASAISFSRVSAKQHFPSDVLIGSTIGWLVGAYVYRTHHNPDLPGAAWPTYAESQDESLHPCRISLRRTRQLDLSRNRAPRRSGLHRLHISWNAPVDARGVRSLVQEAGGNIEANGGDARRRL